MIMMMMMMMMMMMVTKTMMIRFDAIVIGLFLIALLNVFQVLFKILQHHQLQNT